MATYIKAPKSTGANIAELLSGMNDVFKEQQQYQREQQKMQAKEKEQQAFGDYLESIGLSRDDVNLPKQALTAKIKEAQKGRTALQSFGDYFFNNKGSPNYNPNELREGVPGQPLKGNEVTKEQADMLRAQGHQVGLPLGETSLMQKLSSGASGIGQGLLAADPRFLAQNLASGGLNLANMIGRGFGAESNIVPTYEDIQEKGRQGTEGLLDKIIEKLGSSEMYKFYKESEKKFPTPEPLRKISGFVPPTSTQVVESAKELTKGTALEKFAIPQTETQKQYEDLGNVVGLLSNPTQAFAKEGAKGLAKNFAKATGIAVGGDAAGWLTENATGSKTAGDLVRNGTYIAANLFPGTLNTLAKKAYDRFDTKVLDRAERLGKTINLSRNTKPMLNLFPSLRHIYKMAPGEAQTWLLNEHRILKTMIGDTHFNPKAFDTYLKEFSKRLYKAPDQAKGIGNQIQKQMRAVMSDFANKVTPGGANILKEANRLYRTHAQWAEQAKNMKSALSSTFMIGPALLFSGGYKKLIAAGAGLQGARYINLMLKDPTARKMIHQLFKSTAANNTALTKNLMERLNKRATELDPKAAKEMTEILKKQNQ